YFEEKNCDYVILETGLGGRLDSTRAVQRIPDVTVITAIGFDHEAILGNTIEQIAGEKAGVIREKTRVVMARMDAKAQKVIRDTCEKKGVLYCYGEEADLSEYLSKEDHLGLLGAYQKENAENAVMAVKLLDKKEIDTQAIRRGLTKARWPGRMDVLSEDPFILVDGAHNPQGVEALRVSLLSLYPREKFIYIFGVMADKDYEHMLLSMLGTEEMFFTVTVEDARAEKSERIAKFLKEKGGRAKACQSISEAFSKAAYLQKTTGEKIVAFGSLYFIGEVLRLIKKEEIYG
nr:bifunctional folylpolyglutamate synthase/dihydrofolate synthase [Lachnospiraceae bacterium]